MQFLVEITVNLPDELSAPDSPRGNELRAAELERGLELRRTGVIAGIWRRPGEGLRNVGVWNAENEDALREVIRSLPLGPWITAEVTPLSEHPIESERRRAKEEER